LTEYAVSSPGSASHPVSLIFVWPVYPYVVYFGRVSSPFPDWCVFWKEHGKFRFSREKTKKAVVGKVKILLDSNIFDPCEHIEIYPPNTITVMEGEEDEPEEPESTTSS
jgi:hypothetical protein